jgi:hypothetical protein
VRDLAEIFPPLGQITPLSLVQIFGCLTLVFGAKVVRYLLDACLLLW